MVCPAAESIHQAVSQDWSDACQIQGLPAATNPGVQESAGENANTGPNGLWIPSRHCVRCGRHKMTARVVPASTSPRHEG